MVKNVTMYCMEINGPKEFFDDPFLEGASMISSNDGDEIVIQLSEEGPSFELMRVDVNEGLDQEIGERAVEIFGFDESLSYVQVESDSPVYYLITKENLHLLEASWDVDTLKQLLFEVEYPECEVKIDTFEMIVQGEEVQVYECVTQTMPKEEAEDVLEFLHPDWTLVTSEEGAEGELISYFIPDKELEVFPKEEQPQVIVEMEEQIIQMEEEPKEVEVMLEVEISEPFQEVELEVIEEIKQAPTEIEENEIDLELEVEITEPYQEGLVEYDFYEGVEEEAEVAPSALNEMDSDEEESQFDEMSQSDEFGIIDEIEETFNLLSHVPKSELEAFIFAHNLGTSELFLRPSPYVEKGQWYDLKKRINQLKDNPSLFHEVLDSLLNDISDVQKLTLGKLLRFYFLKEGGGSNELDLLIEQLLDKDPKKRPSLELLRPIVRNYIPKL